MKNNVLFCSSKLNDVKKYLPGIILLTIFIFAYRLDKNRNATSEEDEFFRPLAVSLHQAHYDNGKLKKSKSFSSVYRQTRFDTLGFYPFIDAGLTYGLHYQARMLAKSKNKTYRIGNVKFSNRDIRQVINTLQSFQFTFPVGLSNYFDFYQIKGSDGHGNVKFSAYYTPIIAASKTRNDDYFYPVYKRPEDWDGKLPTRQQIENDDVLEGKGLALGYVKSRKDLYKIQLEGTAILKFKDGSTALLSYDGDNNREEGDDVEPVKTVKKEKNIVKKEIENNVEQEEIEETEGDSLDITVEVAGVAIEAEAEEKGVSKEEVEELYKTEKEEITDTDSTDNEMVRKEIDEKAMAENPNYVFFKRSTERLQSSSGVPLSAFSSIATDKRYIPTGAVLMAAVPVVDKNERCKTHALQFVLAQDTGGRIRGAGHIDWYVGKGEKAEKMANRIHHYGQLWLVLPKKKTTPKLTLNSEKRNITLPVERKSKS
jgi:membrane-bound lytic murein transglycosylase A